MTQVAVSVFLDAVERSGLIEKTRLAKALEDLERESSGGLQDSQVISSHLTEAGLLTTWQSQLLLQGRSRGFFIGKYKLLDHIGVGGMSSVFLAEHAVMRRRVAIKVLPAHRVKTTSYLQRFHREARAAAALDHPNIVRAFDVDNEGDTHYMVMEYVDGQDLQSTVERDGPLPYMTVADYICQAAEGLSHAHAAGLVHRDMKPANLLIDPKRTVKVLDLGLVRFSDDEAASLTAEHDEKMLGTVDYLPPEQAVDCHLVDARGDIYSLGCTMYFALTGKPPFPEGTLAQRVVMHQLKEPASIFDKRPDAPRDLVAICRRMMAKSPDDRYQSARDVVTALEQWLATAKKPAAPRLEIRDEDLLLAPLDDEPRGRAKAAGGTSPASGADANEKTRGRPPSDAKPKSASDARPKPPSDARPKSPSDVKRKPSSDVAKQSAASDTAISQTQAAPTESMSSVDELSLSPPNEGGAKTPAASPKPPSGVGRPRARSGPPSPSGKSDVKPASPTPSPAASPSADLIPLAPLDDLLGDLPPSDPSAGSVGLSPGGGSLTPSTGLSQNLSNRSSRKPGLWDSTWFVIAVGVGLGLLVIGGGALLLLLGKD